MRRRFRLTKIPFTPVKGPARFFYKTLKSSLIICFLLNFFALDRYSHGLLSITLLLPVCFSEGPVAKW